jgi:anti-sigma regulatory factor (Ser/Thr protein kinase)
MACLARMTIKSCLEHLVEVRNFVHEVVKQLPDVAVDDDRAYWVALAANEVTANIITHAYQHNPDEVIDIEAQWAHATLVLHFYDRGLPLDLDALSPPTFDAHTENGFGIFMIKQVTDEFRYTRRDNGQNETTLAFRFKGAVKHGG